jgi:hypothetical protein
MRNAKPNRTWRPAIGAAGPVAAARCATPAPPRRRGLLGTLAALLACVGVLAGTTAARAEWAPDARGARSPAATAGLRVIVRYDDACQPELLVGWLSRQRTLRLPRGPVRAAVDGRLVAVGEQSIGQRVQLTEHAVTALRDGDVVTLSVGDAGVEVRLTGAANAIAAAGAHCRKARTLPRVPAVHWTIVSGDIGSGWAQAVMEIVRAVGATGLVLDANGQDLAEAERLGQWIRDRGLSTAVTGDCALACAQAFAGGMLRFVAPGARLGLQRLPLLGGNAGTRGAIVRQAGYLRGLGVEGAQALAERAAATAPGAVDWLGAEEAIALGLATELGTPGGIAALGR